MSFASEKNGPFLDTFFAHFRSTSSVQVFLRDFSGTGGGGKFFFLVFFCLFLGVVARKTDVFFEGGFLYMGKVPYL